MPILKVSDSKKAPKVITSGILKKGTKLDLSVGKKQFILTNALFSIPSYTEGDVNVDNALVDLYWGERKVWTNRIPQSVISDYDLMKLKVHNTWFMVSYNTDLYYCIMGYDYNPYNPS